MPLRSDVGVVACLAPFGFFQRTWAENVPAIEGWPDKLGLNSFVIRGSKVKAKAKSAFFVAASMVAMMSSGKVSATIVSPMIETFYASLNGSTIYSGTMPFTGGYGDTNGYVYTGYNNGYDFTSYNGYYVNLNGPTTGVEGKKFFDVVFSDTGGFLNV